MPEVATTGASGVGSPAAASPRLTLARLASEAALVVPGVAGLTPGAGPSRAGLSGTWAGEEHVPGVAVFPEGGGDRFGVALAIEAELVDLVALTRDVQRAVRIAAAAAGLEDHLGPVSVRVVDLVDARSEAA